jgi:hypothetical protein
MKNFNLVLWFLAILGVLCEVPSHNQGAWSQQPIVVSWSYNIKYLVFVLPNA